MTLKYMMVMMWDLPKKIRVIKSDINIVLGAWQMKQMCKKYQSTYVCSDLGKMVNLNLESLNQGIMPLNGLRHPPEGPSTGWFIWAGREIPQENVKFFQSMHTSHLVEGRKLFIKYLGLAPGWRFQIDDKGYEDVWFDEKLLED